MKQPAKLSTSLITLFTVILILSGFYSPVSAQSTSHTVAIMPFNLISAEKLTSIQAGTVQMLRSRLLWKGKVSVINPDTVNQHLTTLETTDPNARITQIAQLTNSDYVITGDIIQFANAFSIDAKIYDIKNKQYLAFFEQSKTIDELVPKINLLAAKINKKVFQRETTAFESLVKKQKQQAEEWRRQNPEKLLPSLPQGEPEEKTPIWKIWKYL